MTDAEKRLQDLLDRWLASVECHARYVKLDDAAYARVETWPRHQRPTKWIVDLAKQRLQELYAEAGRRRAAGDAAFADALERMSFLTGLLGSEHLERFIPMATGEFPAATGADAPEQPRSTRATRRSAVKSPPSRATTTPVEPLPSPGQRTSVPTPAPPADDPVARQVIADAIRLLDWGREWPALAGLIARMADRPSESDVWRILRAHRASILGPVRHAPR